MERSSKDPDITVIMPCLNEETTIGICIEEARHFIESNQLKGEIIIVDNASEDASARIALSHGATLITENRRGYGRAIRTGINAASGKVLIIGDCDTTYDFLHLESMYRLIADQRYDVIIGNRYLGGMEKGSMPLSHRMGVRFLSWCARIRFQTNVYDFHCGLRAISKKAAQQMNFQTDGMEFATEMIAISAKSGFRIGQIPVPLRKCQYERSSKLKTIKDGFRHLKYIITTK